MAANKRLAARRAVQLKLVPEQYPAPVRLVALLCNPPTNRAVEQTITWKNLTVLAGLFGLADIEIVNLVSQATASTDHLFQFVGTVDYKVLATQTRIAARGAVVVAAWGTDSPPGWPCGEWRKLVAAAMSGAEAAGQKQLVHIGPKTRHPSRWRQFTSPVHKRFSGATFEARLTEAIRWSSPAELLAAF